MRGDAINALYCSGLASPTYSARCTSVVKWPHLYSEEEWRCASKLQTAFYFKCQGLSQGVKWRMAAGEVEG